MAKKHQQNKYDLRHWNNLKKYESQLDAIYREAIREAIAISGSIASIDTDKIFSFDDYPSTRKRMESLIEDMKSQVEAVVLNGIDAEWTLANNKNSELANWVFGDAVGKLTQAQYRRYYSTNDSARRAFAARRVDGLNLSQRVWNLAGQFKSELELGLDVGIRSGRSADDLSRDIRQYLRRPDMLFRRVRDEHGNLQLSRRAAAYHPGRGVYRSSYKNARRLAATETNIAYRTADHLRWQQMDFVVGIEIRTSPTNHPVPDICDDLKGKYPKDFKFTGWHPHCRCHAITILKTQEEVDADTQRILNGEPPSDPNSSVNAVTDMPENFTKWYSDNGERILNANSLPYFIRDNQSLVKQSADKLALLEGWDAFGKAALAKSTGEDLSGWVDKLYETDNATSQIFRHRYVKGDWDTLVNDFLSTKMSQAEMNAARGVLGGEDPIEDFILKHGRRTSVPVSALRPTQGWVGESFQYSAAKDLGVNAPIPIIHIKGTERYYVVNGHHRAMNQILWGHEKIDACVIEAPNSLMKKLSAPDKIDRIIAKQTAENISIRNLQNWGFIDNSFIWLRTEYDAVVQKHFLYQDKAGNFKVIPEEKMDLMIFKHKNGLEFAYPIDVMRSKAFSAVEASEAIAELPPYLRRGIERVSFIGKPCPMDPYWRMKYNNPNHVSMATDGGSTHFWMRPDSKESFKGYMTHEAGHILDGEKYDISSSRAWQEAVAKDDEIYRQHKVKNNRVSKYAETNDYEDFAECMRVYIMDHEYLKTWFPNRAEFIRKMAQRLSGHFPKRP